jgi:hypothetical protein
MSTDPKLPEAFASLEPFAASWCDLQTMSQRYVQRQEMPLSELRRFWEAMAPQLETVFQHLDRFPKDRLPEPEARLFRMSLGLVEASEAVELLGSARMVGAPFPHLVEEATVDLPTGR